MLLAASTLLGLPVCTQGAGALNQLGNAVRALLQPPVKANIAFI